MAKRFLLAGILGGIAMYAWTSVAHLILPLGTVGVSEITTNEDAVLNALHASLGGAHGLYFYPGMGLGPNPSMQQMRDAMPAYSKKVATMPSGILIYNPPSGSPVAMSPGQLITEFLAELVQVMLAVMLLAKSRASGFGARLGFMTVVGIIGALVTNVSYWNWYRFPGNYTLAYMFIEVVGFVVAGAVAALILGRGGSKAQAAAA